MANDRFTMPVAVHLFLLKDEQILLLRRFNTGYEDGNYSVIAGHLDGNEPVLTAMKREALEEGGIELDASNLRIVQVMHRLTPDREYIDYFLTCSVWSGELTNLEPDKCDELRWTRIGDLPTNVVPYVRAAIRAWQSGISFTAHGFEDAAGS